MPFSDFHGNELTLDRMRRMLAHERFPHAVIISGPNGAGKYTLAQMLAKAAACLSPPTGALPDFCDHCDNCVRIATADDLDARCDEAFEARENLNDTDKRETRVLIQTHPDVLIIPPDPPQMMVKIGQIRKLIETIYFRPTQAKRKFFIITSSALMKEAANSLLKVLEEPPEFATIVLLTQNAGELLPTIRSRCIHFSLAPLSVVEVEKYLAIARPEWKQRERALVARLSEGAIGRAKTFDLETYGAARKDALQLLQSVAVDDHSELFRMTDSYRGGGEGKDKFDSLLRVSYTLLEDLLQLQSGTSDLVRNTDLLPELQKLNTAIDIKWIERAAQGLGQLQSGMRRNLLRGLSLDSFAASLER
jgi:DNA polymerase III subunit delta'